MGLKITECPRDAMQGLDEWIPTELKSEYINQLLRVGFDTIDFGSFVSPKAIPQLRDTAEVLSRLDLSQTRSKLLAIVANTRGANDALNFDQIDVLGYPFSISETFQKRNTNATIEESMKYVEEMQSLCLSKNKTLLIYISMAFGNPYGDAWSADLAASWMEKLNSNIGINHFALADTVGQSTDLVIKDIFSTVMPAFPNCSIAAHLHSTSNETDSKILAAYKSGCRKFDSAIHGFGGCPMAEDELVGNVATEKLIEIVEHLESTGLNKEEFNKSLMLASRVFPS
jgi:hydroxymethylglutaryl-CoA lyase